MPPIGVQQPIGARRAAGPDTGAKLATRIVTTTKCDWGAEVEPLSLVSEEVN